MGARAPPRGGELARTCVDARTCTRHAPPRAGVGMRARWPCAHVMRAASRVAHHVQDERRRSAA
eukprot:5295077-Pleurochrysis_carterae.AAC.1